MYVKRAASLHDIQYKKWKSLQGKKVKKAKKPVDKLKQAVILAAREQRVTLKALRLAARLEKRRNPGKGLIDKDVPVYESHLAGYNPGPYVIRDYGKARESLLGVTSTNNGKLRPWSNLSYRKVKIVGDLHYAKEWNDIGHWPSDGSPFYTTDGEGYADINFGQNLWFDWTWDLLGGVSADTNAIALAKLNASLKDSRAQMQLAITLAEGRSTARMITRAASRIYHSARALRKGNLSEAWHHVMGRAPIPKQNRRAHAHLESRMKSGKFATKDDFANNWLEFNYGWRPLLSDVDSAAKYLAEKHVKQSFGVYPFRRQHKHVVEKGYAVQKSPGSDQGGLWYEIDKDLEKVAYTYELYPDFIRKPSTLGELGFLDPATVAWELVPYSFVVDWFVNVGQVLESLYEFRQWKVKRGLKSTKQSLLRSRISLSSPKWYEGGKFRRTGGVVYQGIDHSKYRRDLYYSLPTSVPLRVKIDNPFDLKSGQFATSLALLHQQFGEGKPSTTFRR